MIGAAAVPKVTFVESAWGNQEVGGAEFPVRDNLTRPLDPAKESVIGGLKTVSLGGDSLAQAELSPVLPTKSQQLGKVDGKRGFAHVLLPTSKAVQAVHKSRKSSDF